MNSSWSDIDSIIAKNEEQRARLFAPYNPFTGEGSPIERFHLSIDGNSFLRLPIIMRDLPLVASIVRAGSISSYAHQTKRDEVDVEQDLTALRIAYDFEFWSATCARVQDKQTKRAVPFILRPAQLKLLVVLMSSVCEGAPIRVILLKARQWGGSTLVQLFMAWIQLFHRTSWHSVIVADVEDQARNIRKMYSRLAEYHPHQVLPVKFRPFEGSSKNREVVGRQSVIYLSSMQQPDSIRSADVMMAHLSEVGLWKQTLGKRPEDVIQSIAGTIAAEPYSLIVIESTAKGIGNFFHRSWIEATASQSGYTPVFVAWWEIEIYQKPFADDVQMRDFIRSLSDKERYYFSLGATLEGINWYRSKQQLEQLDAWRMACEYPSTPAEAFQSTGSRAHAPQYIEGMRRFCRQPLFIGDITSDTLFGRDAIGGSMAFVESAVGALWLWALPDKEVAMSSRYVVSLDIGGRSDGADYSVISIVDRYWLTEGGVEECIGTWRGHLDQDLVVWRAVQVARLFDNALLVVESNSLDAKGAEGDHSLTILDEIKDYYDNLYFRTDPQLIREGLPPRYGFHTNRATKTDLVTKMNRRFRECSYIERDGRALDEADWYEVKPDGSYGAVDGQHDDVYMSRAIALLVSEQMPLPKLIPQKNNSATTSHTSATPILSAANF